MRVEDELLSDDEVDATHELALSGKGLTPDDVATLERELAQTPHRLVPRIRLLGYYFLRSAPAEVAARQRHVAWIIEHAPRTVIAGLPYAALRACDRDEHATAYANAWRERVAQSGDDAATLRNAGQQLAHHDPPTAQRYLERAYAVEPSTQNARALALQHLLYGDAKEALTLYERHLDDGGERFAHLVDAGRAALAAGEDQKALAYADELVTRAPHETDREFVEGLHHGHILRGRIALRRGDVESARRALLAAADAPRFFDEPDMTLANELAARGDDAIVATYVARTQRGPDGDDSV